MDWTFAFKWLLATGGVIGLIFLVFSFGGKKLFRKGRDLEILEGVSLGNRQGIYLVRAKERILVIGISHGSMQVLTEFDADKNSASHDFKNLSSVEKIDKKIGAHMMEGEGK